MTVKPGGNSIDVPVAIEGNTRYSYDVANDAFVKAVHGAVVGSYRGGVTVQNDDPMPEVIVTPVADQVTEGHSLKWRITLSEAADSDIRTGVVLLPAGTGAELSTADVEPGWLQHRLGAQPTPVRPLSKAVEGTFLGKPLLYVPVPAGGLSVEVEIPTIVDTTREPEESARIQLVVFDESFQPHWGPVFTGIVRDTYS